MNEDVGSGLQLKSQDELIGRDGKFIQRGARRSSNKGPRLSHSEDEQYFEATDNLNTTSVPPDTLVDKVKEFK